MKITAENIKWETATPEHVIYCILRARRVDFARANEIFDAAKEKGINLGYNEVYNLCRQDSMYDLAVVDGKEVLRKNGEEVYNPDHDTENYHLDGVGETHENSLAASSARATVHFGGTYPIPSHGATNTTTNMIKTQVNVNLSGVTSIDSNVLSGLLGSSGRNEEAAEPTPSGNSEVMQKLNKIENKVDGVKNAVTPGKGSMIETLPFSHNASWQPCQLQ